MTSHQAKSEKAPSAIAKATLCPNQPVETMLRPAMLSQKDRMMKKVYTLDQEKARSRRLILNTATFFGLYMIISLFAFVIALGSSAPVTVAPRALIFAIVITPFWFICLFFANKEQKAADSAFRVELDEDVITLHQKGRTQISFKKNDIKYLLFNYFAIVFILHKKIHIISNAIKKNNEFKDNFEVNNSYFYRIFNFIFSIIVLFYALFFNYFYFDVNFIGKIGINSFSLVILAVGVWLMEHQAAYNARAKQGFRIIFIFILLLFLLYLAIVIIK